MSENRQEQARKLEQRLVDFAVRVMALVDALPKTPAGRHIGSQLLRSATSPAPNYSEAQSAESRRDFVHKLKISLKELRETLVWLKMIRQREIFPAVKLDPLMNECEQLIAIFVSSVNKATRSIDKGAEKLKEPSDL